MDSEAKRERFVELSAYWADGNAVSTVKIGCRIWEKIQAGGSYSISAWSFCEGDKDAVVWSFSNCEYSIDGEDGRQCVVEQSIDELS